MSVYRGGGSRQGQPLLLCNVPGPQSTPTPSTASVLPATSLTAWLATAASATRGLRYEEHPPEVPPPCTRTPRPTRRILRAPRPSSAHSRHCELGRPAALRRCPPPTRASSTATAGRPRATPRTSRPRSAPRARASSRASRISTRCPTWTKACQLPEGPLPQSLRGRRPIRASGGSEGSGGSSAAQRAG